MDRDGLRARRRWYETHRLDSRTVTVPWWRRVIAAIVDLVPRPAAKRTSVGPQPTDRGPGGPAGVREPRRPRPTAPQVGAAPLPPEDDRDN